MERRRETVSDLRAAKIEHGGDRWVVFSWTPGSSPDAAPSGLDAALTAAERAVCALLVAGLSDADIASLRGTTRSTITKQVDAIFRKLGVRSRRELIARHAAR